MRFQFHSVVEGLRAEARCCLALWPLVLIAVLVTAFLWSSAVPASVHAFQSPPSPSDSPIPSPTLSPTATTPPTATPVASPAQEPAPSNPAARLLLWIGIGLLVVAAVVGVVLVVQRQRG